MAEIRTFANIGTNIDFIFVVFDPTNIGLATQIIRCAPSTFHKQRRRNAVIRGNMVEYETKDHIRPYSASIFGFIFGHERIERIESRKTFLQF